MATMKLNFHVAAMLIIAATMTKIIDSSPVTEYNYPYYPGYPNWGCGGYGYPYRYGRYGYTFPGYYSSFDGDSYEGYGPYPSFPTYFGNYGESGYVPVDGDSCNEYHILPVTYPAYYDYPSNNYDGDFVDYGYPSRPFEGYGYGALGYPGGPWRYPGGAWRYPAFEGYYAPTPVGVPVDECNDGYDSIEISTYAAETRSESTTVTAVDTDCY